MKRTVVFAGVIGVLLAGTVAARADNDTPYFAPDTPANYPGFTEQAQTIGTGANAQQFAAGSIKDDFIKLATTKYVDKKVDDVNDQVVTLNNSANTANTAVTANEDDIDDLEENRQVVPQTNTCSGNDIGEGQNYAACGYISSGGTGTNQASEYAWVKIAAEPCASNETCLATN